MEESPLMGDVGVEPGYLCFFVNPLGDSDMHPDLSTNLLYPYLSPTLSSLLS